MVARWCSPMTPRRLLAPAQPGLLARIGIVIAIGIVFTLTLKIRQRYVNAGIGGGKK